MPRDSHEASRKSNSKITSRRGFAKACGIGGIATISGCTGLIGSDGTTELRVIHSLYDQEQEVFDELKEEYKEENDVEFDEARVGWEEAEQRITEAEAAGNPYDIIVMATDILPEAVENNIVSPMTDVIQDLGGTDHFLETTLLDIDDEYWIAPIDANPFNYIWRRDFVDEYGAPAPPYDSLDELLEAAESMTDPDENIYGHPVFTQGFFPGDWATCLLLGNGGNIYDEDGQVVFDSQEAVEVFETIKELDNYSPEAAYTASIPEQRPPLYEGRYAMTWYSRNMVAYDIEEYNPDLTGDVQLSTFPSGSGHEPVVNTVVKGWTIAESSENKAEASEFIKYVLSVENMTDWMQGFATSSVPGVKGILDEDEFWEHPLLSEYEDVYRTLYDIQENYARAIPIAENPGVVNTNTGRAIQGLYITECIQDVVHDDLDPEEAVENTANSIRDEIGEGL